MRDVAVDTLEGGKRRTHGRADANAGKGVTEVLDRKGDSALGNTNAAHEQRGDAHLTVGVIELVLGDERSEATGDRGNGDGDAEHTVRTVDTGGHDGHGEGRGGLVDGATHIEGGHNANDQTQDNCGTALQAAEHAGEPVHHKAKRRGQDVDIGHAQDKRGQNRDDQDGHDGLDGVVDLPGLHPADKVAADDRHDHGAQEAGRNAVAVRGNDCVVDQVAQDKTGGERGLAGHRVGDVCRKHRDHHGDAGHADGVKAHHQRVRNLHAVGAGGTGCQREGKKHAADNDDGDKIGNAGIECIEQRLARIGKDRLLGRRCRGLQGSGDGLLLCLGLGLGRVNGATRRLDDLNGLVDDLYRIGDYIRGADLQELALGHLLLKTVLVLNTHVDGLQDQVGRIHVFLRQLVLDTQATLSLDLALDATGGAFILNRLLGHIRVGDTHSTGGNAYDLHCFPLFIELRAQDTVCGGLRSIPCRLDLLSFRQDQYRCSFFLMPAYFGKRAGQSVGYAI